MRGRPKGYKKSGGRQKGVTNKVTLQAREAIAMFVDNNAHRLKGWLDRVAEEQPAEAFKLFQSVIEYHIPKLQRSEVTQTGNMNLEVKQKPATLEEAQKVYNEMIKQSQIENKN